MDYIKIGKIQNTYGLAGKIIIKQEPENALVSLKLKHIFIELHRESYIPFFIETMKKLDDSETLMQLEDIATVEAAKALLGKNVFVEQAVYGELQANPVFSDLTGFTVTDKKAGVLGKIESLFETPGQVIAALAYKGKEILIPLVDSTILKIDADKKQISVSLPEGLIDIYLD